MTRTVDGRRYSPLVMMASGRGNVGRPYTQFLVQKVRINCLETLDLFHILAGAMGDLEADVGVHSDKVQLGGGGG